jgi:hypothetical protein
MCRGLTTVLEKWIVWVSFCQLFLIFVCEVQVVKGENDRG